MKLASRGSVRTAVAGAVGRKHVDCHPRQVEVVKANQHVSSKKGFCEICKINFSDMKMVSLLYRLNFFAFQLQCWRHCLFIFLLWFLPYSMY